MGLEICIYSWYGSWNIHYLADRELEIYIKYWADIRGVFRGGLAPTEAKAPLPGPVKSIDFRVFHAPTGAEPTPPGKKKIYSPPPSGKNSENNPGYGRVYLSVRDFKKYSKGGEIKYHY